MELKNVATKIKNSKDKINFRSDPESNELENSCQVNTQNLALSDNKMIFNIVVNRHRRYLERLHPISGRCSKVRRWKK